jgi:hypothetical protein
VQRAGFDLARLGDRSAAELSAFRHAAGKVLDDLECVYSLLIDGMEDVALATLRSSSDDSARLAAEARQLATDFEAAADGVQTTLQLAVRRRAEQEERRKALAADVAEFRILLEAARGAKAASDVGFEEAHALYEEALRREAMASLKSSAMQVAQVATAVGSMVSARPTLHMVGLGGVTALASAFEAEVVRVREEKAVHLHERQKQRMLRLDAGKEVAELTARLRVAREEDLVAEEAVRSLEDAAAGLRVLAGVMLKAEVFWGQVQTSLGQSDAVALVATIEGSGTLVAEKKAELWVTDAFKRRAVAVYSPWVALQSVCGVYVEKLRGTRATLYGMFEDSDQCESPTADAMNSSSSGSSVSMD